MSGHLSVDGVVGGAVLSLADLLGLSGTGHFHGLGVAGLAEYREQDHPAARGEPVGDAGLLGQQVEPQLPDLAAKVTGVGLAEVRSVFGKQADEEIDPAEVTVGQILQPGPYFGLDLHSVARYASDAICISC